MIHLPNGKLDLALCGARGGKPRILRGSSITAVLRPKKGTCPDCLRWALHPTQPNRPLIEQAARRARSEDEDESQWTTLYDLLPDAYFHLQ